MPCCHRLICFYFFVKIATAKLPHFDYFLINLWLTIKITVLVGLAMSDKATTASHGPPKAASAETLCIGAKISMQAMALKLMAL